MAERKKQSTEAAVREIRRRTRRKFAPEEKIRIVLEGLRGVERLGRQLEASLGMTSAESARWAREGGDGAISSVLPKPAPYF